jgi:hypothetical protein
MSTDALLDELDVTVTASELTVGDARYDLTSVRSAKSLRVPAAATGPILMIVVGVLCLLAATGDAGTTGLMTGIGLVGAALVWWTQKKPTFVVQLETAEGEISPVESRDSDFVTRIVDAIQRAGKERGREERGRS